MPRRIATRHDGAVTQPSDEEQWAQACIQQALPQCTVRQHDDGSQSGMYDVEIAYPDGSLGALEITAAADAQQVELWKLIGGQGKRWLVPGLTGGWVVSVMPTARARPMYERVPGLLRGLERDGIPVLWGKRSSADPLAALAGELRIVEARQGPTAHPGSIYPMIHQPLEQMGGYSPQTGDPLARWLDEWLAEPTQADNVQKVARSKAQEKHIFVLVRGFSPAPYPVVDLLISPGAPLPVIPPALPAPITHVWAMSGWSMGGGFRWSPAQGWSRFTKLKP